MKSINHFIERYLSQRSSSGLFQSSANTLSETAVYSSNKILDFTAMPISSATRISNCNLSLVSASIFRVAFMIQYLLKSLFLNRGCVKHNYRFNDFKDKKYYPYYFLPIQVLASLLSAINKAAIVFSFYKGQFFFRVALLFFLTSLVSLESFGQVSKAPLQNFSNAGGATGTITSGIPTHFSSIGQPTVLARPASTSTGGGVMTANELMFSAIAVVDSSPPTFGANGTATSVSPALALAITADFVDAESNVVEALVQYRSVSASGTAPPDIQLTKGTGNNWTGTIPATSIGELGVEYKFKIKNGALLEATSQLNKVVINHAFGTTIVINTTFSKSQSNYRIIANPLILSPNTIDAIFSEELGGYDENVWRMYRYQAGNISKLSKSSTMDIGKGYWFLSTKPPTNNVFTTGAGTTVPVSVDEPFEITLSPGWNQIGNPYNFDISWNDVRAANPALSSKLSTTARSYNGGVIEIDEIKKFEGAYISFTGTTADKIKIPVTKNPAINNGRIRSRGIENSLSNDHWEVKFNLSNGLQHYTLGGMGMHPQASESVDVYDDFNIPRFFEYLEVKHPKQLYDMSYTKDVVPTQQEHTWNFSTESNQEGENITLAWAD